MLAAHALAAELPQQWLDGFDGYQKTAHMHMHMHGTSDSSRTLASTEATLASTSNFLAPRDISLAESRAGVEHVRGLMQTADEAAARDGGDQWLGEAIGWEKTKLECNSELRSYLSGLIGINQNLGHKYASLGADRNATKHHLITLRASWKAWEMDKSTAGGSSSEPSGRSTEKGELEWWQTDFALRAVQGVLAAQVLSDINTRRTAAAHANTQTHAPPPPPEAANHGNRDSRSHSHYSTANEGTPGLPPTASASALPALPALPALTLKSGYPVFQYQQQLLDDILPPMAGRSIDRVEASITPEELYNNYISKGKPVIIKRGLISKWFSDSDAQ